MIRLEFFGCIIAMFFLSYNLILIQFSIGQGPQAVDVHPPLIKTPPFIIARATGPAWTQVNFQVSANSSTSDNIPVYCSPGSRCRFPMGETIVLCAANENLTGLVSYAIFNVTVKDTSPPEFKVPYDILKEGIDLQSTKISYNANASDNIDGNTIPICDPPSGSTFPLGTNYVTCTATDKSGNIAESTFSVIIKAPKGKISSTEKGISKILQNITNQPLPSKLAVSDNITNMPQPLPSKLAVSDNITNMPEPTVPVIENRTQPSPPTVINNDILNMFKILIDDLK